ncbi:hypothetical protein ACFE04_022947 [Oxalis oulophora]
MTSASELFYTRRSRVGRPDPDPDFDLFYNHNRRFHHHHHHRHAPPPPPASSDACDPLRRSSPHPHPRHASIIERRSTRLGLDQQPTGPFASRNNVNADISTNLGFTANERLPGAVLLARARLVERLRGVSVSNNRRSSRGPSSINHRDYWLSDEIRLVDAGDWGTAISAGWSDSSSPSMDETKKMKPPGLSEEALNALNWEVYCTLGVVIRGDVSWDCSICLESFIEGDKLICLPCQHRFHAVCLDPWLRACGDCPYCRRVIVSNPNN